MRAIIICDDKVYLSVPLDVRSAWLFYYIPFEWYSKA